MELALVECWWSVSVPQFTCLISFIYDYIYIFIYKLTTRSQELILFFSPFHNWVTWGLDKSGKDITERKKKNNQEANTGLGFIV